MALKAPFVAQDVFEQEFTRVARFIEGAVVSAHHRFDFGFHDQLFESWKVCIVEVVFRNDGIEGVAIFFGTGMNSIMFSAGCRFEIFGMIALQAFDKLGCHFAGKEWILTPGFLSAPPAWVAENVDIRRPERQSLELVSATIAAQGFVVFGTGLVPNGSSDPVYQVLVPGGSQANCL